MRAADPPGLTAANRSKLAAIAAMLASDHAGERDAAALAATRFLKRHGLTWADVLAPTPNRAPQVHSRTPDGSLADLLHDWPVRWRGAVQACLSADAVLTEWDWRFLCCLRRYRARPSDRQLEILYRIAERVLLERAA